MSITSLKCVETLSQSGHFFRWFSGGLFFIWCSIFLENAFFNFRNFLNCPFIIFRGPGSTLMIVFLWPSAYDHLRNLQTTFSIPAWIFIVFIHIIHFVDVIPPPPLVRIVLKDWSLSDVIKFLLYHRWTKTNIRRG